MAATTSLTQLSHLIGRLYAAILEPLAWQEALADVCLMLNAKAASVHTFNPMEGKIGLYVEHGCDPAYTRSLFSTYAAMTPTGASIFLAEVGEPTGVFDFIDEEEFRASRFYQEWCLPQGYFDMLGALISKQPREIGAISATRLESQSRFTGSDRELLALVAPHVRQAITISGLLENRVREIEQLADTIDQLGCAVIIVSAGGQIIRANVNGRLELAAGSVLQVSEGAIAARDTVMRRALKSALESEKREPLTLALPAADGSKKLLAVMPLDAGTGTFALFIKTEEPDIPALGRHLVKAFNLTPREVGVLMPLLEGCDPAEVADKLGIAVSTVRTHLQRLFAKTGTSSQAELVGLILKAMPPVKIS